jgi:hypothetical protein
MQKLMQAERVSLMKSLKLDGDTQKGGSVEIRFQLVRKKLSLFTSQERKIRSASRQLGVRQSALPLQNKEPGP